MAQITHMDTSRDTNLVAMWLRWDPVRWIAGALAGLFAGVMALVLAMLLSAAGGMEFWYPAKLIAAILIGPSATEFGMNFGTILVGFALHEVLCMVLGIIYAHFTGTNFLPALLGMGFVWGAFSWIFLWNLFGQSFRPILWAAVPSSVVFPICMVFGVALTSVAFFDQALRGH